MSTPAFPASCWPLPDSECCEGFDDLDPFIADRAVALATQTLRALTLYQVGGCPVTIRPCTTGLCGGADSWLAGGFYPVNWSGVWTNCGCGGTCIHNGLNLADLGFGHVVGPVSGVKIDGVAFTNYAVLGTTIVRTDGQAWPAGQDMTKPDTQVGTWSITYLPAHEVDALGAYALGVLACEYARACGGQDCRLPSGVVSVVRAGIQYQITPGSFPNGYTGINEVDAYIRRWNPFGLTAPAQVWSPTTTTTYTWRP